MSLIAVSVVGMLAAAFTHYVSSVVKRQAGAVDRKRAFYAAEAGLAESFAGVLQGKSGTVGSEAAPAIFGEGLFWVEAVDVGGRRVRLDSTGMNGRARSELSLVVERGQETLMDLGLFSGGDMTIPPGTLIDAWDSRKGGYEEGRSAGARVVANGGILVAGSEELPTVIRGDVTSGPTSNVDVTGPVKIDGVQCSAPDAVEIPAIPTPAVRYEPGGTIDSPFPMVIPPSQAGYRSLLVADGSEVVIQGPAVVVVDRLRLDPGAELSFDTTGGPVRLFVKDELAFEPGSVVTTSSVDPRQVMLLAPQAMNEALRLRATSTFHGIVAAPESTILLGQAFEVFGSLAGLNVTFEGPGRLHFDLGLIALADELETPRTLSWKIEEMSVRVDGQSDPFSILGVVRGLLSPPGDAHADQWLEIRYLDASGLLRTYTGWESAFDWSLVRAVVRATRDGVTLVIPSRDRLRDWGDALGTNLGDGGVLGV